MSKKSVHDLFIDHLFGKKISTQDRILVYFNNGAVDYAEINALYVGDKEYCLELLCKGCIIYNGDMYGRILFDMLLIIADKILNGITNIGCVLCNNYKYNYSAHHFIKHTELSKIAPNIMFDFILIVICHEARQKQLYMKYIDNMTSEEIKTLLVDTLYKYRRIKYENCNV